MRKSKSRETDAINARDHLLRLVVQESTAATKERLRTECVSLSAAELRGYVRARAVQPVRRLAKHISAEAQLSIGETNALAESALERTVHAIVRDVLSRPLVTANAALGTTRAAA